MSPIGTHYLIDFWGVSPAILNSPTWLAKTMTVAIKRGQLTEVDRVTKWFDPQGVTMIGVLAESHISFHTYPEERYIAVDIYSCGQRGRPEEAIDVLMEHFAPESFDIRQITRGERPRESISGPS